jgi:hypothetical protein
LRRPRFVEGLAGLLPFGRDGGNVCGFHAAEVLLSKLSKLLVAEVEHGGLLQEQVAMGLEVIDLPFQPFALLGKRQQLPFVLFLDLVQAGGEVTAELGPGSIRARVTGAVIES